jgi:O-antigen/teichoic acid export membrane protein
MRVHLRSLSLTQKNAAFAAGQIVVASAFFFINYGLIWYLLGTEAFGLWSIIASVTNIGNIAYLGFSSSVVQFTAQFSARGETDRLNALVRNNLLVVGGLTLLFSVGLYLLTPRLYADSLRTVEASYFARVLLLNLLGMALASLCTSFMAVLEGVQRLYVKSILLSIGALLNTLTVAALVPGSGLEGAALGYVLSGTFLLGASYWQARRYVPNLAVWPLRWNRTLFRQTAAFGAKAQGIAVLQLLLDPMVKYLLSRFAALEFIAYFEIANKLVMQARMVVMASFQALVPKVAATLHEPEAFTVARHRLLLTLAATGTALAVGVVWLGGAWVEQTWPDAGTQTVVACLQALTLGWGFNVVTLPAYFLFWGLGLLRYNLTNQLLLAGLNVALALPLGYLAGGPGVVWGWAGAAVISSGYTLWAFGRRFRLSAEQWRVPGRLLLGSCLTAVLLAVATAGFDSVPATVYILLLSLHVAVVFVTVRTQAILFYSSRFIR